MHIFTARALALDKQLYRFAGHQGKADTLNVIKTLSYVQLDTVTVIERAHHHTLYNRVREYQPAYLDELLAQDKAVFEHWAHAAGYLPIEDFPYYQIRMRNFPLGAWEKAMWNKHKDLAEPILKRIKEEGPLSSKDFEDTRLHKEPSGWGNWKPAKIVLELLLLKGDLMCASRNNFNRIYDLTERVLPGNREMQMPSAEERAIFMVLRTLQAHGIASEGDINNHIKLAAKTDVSHALTHLLKEDVIRKESIDGLKEAYFCLTETPLGSYEDFSHPSRVYLLSPFDNAVILRKRLLQLFDFDYTMECYVSPAKRKFGYWVLPVLYKGSFVGKMDVKADRKSGIFLVHALHLDKKLKTGKAFQTALEKELTAFAAFHSCSSWTVTKTICI